MEPVFKKLIVVFLITQFLGLWVAAGFIREISSGEMEQPGVISDNPEDPLNALALIGGILFFTAALLVFMAFFKGNFLFRAMETLVVFTASVMVFVSFIPEVAFMFAVYLVAFRLLFPANLFVRNVAAMIAISGVGALIGVTLGVIPVLIFLILLSVYDYIAVFKTKHMVSLAKGITNKNLAFTISLPTKEHQFEIGTGDFVLPLVFAVSVMSSSQGLGFPLFVLPALLIMAASLTGLLFTIAYVKKHVGTALPALPPQAALMIIAWLFGKAIGF